MSGIGRNTPEAPALERCRTCGATKLDGNGAVKMSKGVMQCALCYRGARDLLKEDADTWGWDVERGGLYRKTPDPTAEKWEADVNELHDALVNCLFGSQYAVERGHPNSFAVVTMPNGYRWHVYRRGSDVAAAYSARLFTSTRSMAQPPVHVALSEVLSQAVIQVAALCLAAQEPTKLRERIEDDAFRRITTQAEIDSFDPSKLLEPQPGEGA